jgi:hypothetical protein
MKVHGTGAGSGNLTVEGTATGEVVVDLGSVAPTSATMETHTDAGMDAGGGKGLSRVNKMSLVRR